MRKKVLSLIMVCMLVCTGCQLAKPEAAEVVTSDRLVGMYITTEYLDLTDNEAWLNDNMAGMENGTAYLEMDDSNAQKLWAVYVSKTVTNDDGTTHTTGNYEFPDLEGNMLAVFEMDDSNGSYVTAGAGDALVDVRMFTNQTDNGKEKGISASIYASTDAERVTFYCNPVYQTPDGKVYLLPGTGIFTDTEYSSESVYAIDDSVTVTENGETKVNTFRAELTMGSMMPSRAVEILEVAKNHTVLAQHSLLPDQLPEEFSPSQETAYLLVEEILDDGIRRTLIQPEDAWVKVFTQGSNTLCTQTQIKILWQA